MRFGLWEGVRIILFNHINSIFCTWVEGSSKIVKTRVVIPKGIEAGEEREPETMISSEELVETVMSEVVPKVTLIAPTFPIVKEKGMFLITER